ncbi:10225_t:CDS:1, partial [Cetraspora pellucida]
VVQTSLGFSFYFYALTMFCVRGIPASMELYTDHICDEKKSDK